MSNYGERNNNLDKLMIRLGKPEKSTVKLQERQYPEDWITSPKLTIKNINDYPAKKRKLEE